MYMLLGNSLDWFISWWRSILVLGIPFNFVYAPMHSSKRQYLLCASILADKHYQLYGDHSKLACNWIACVRCCVENALLIGVSQNVHSSKPRVHWCEKHTLIFAALQMFRCSDINMVLNI